MTTITNIETKPINEIIKSECQERRYKEIKMKVFNNGILYSASKILMYSRLTLNEYFIVLSTNKGYLVSTHLDIEHAEEEFSFLCLQNESIRSSIINLFGFTQYDKNMEKIINLKDGLVVKDALVVDKIV